MKPAIRFAIAAGLVLVFATPVAAATRQDDLIPNPARQAVFHRSQASGVTIGSLRIPAIGLNETIRSGVALSVIDKGVAQWSGTVRPGEDGNVVLAGHRTTKTRPFLNLDRLASGDLIFVADGVGFEVMYRVSDAFVVEPNDLWITYDSPNPTLTMFACHPKGSERYRIVITADLLAGRRIA
ncbi:MAG: hypothetical protein BMS9Abin12_1741 [Acidimicrobiia bacterium]|nr:MAG: hypothetical protein BMS9Abin12_1741 [Acidimicrobiia bacterium]